MIDVKYEIIDSDTKKSITNEFDVPFFFSEENAFSWLNSQSNPKLKDRCFEIIKLYFT